MGVGEFLFFFFFFLPTCLIQVPETLFLAALPSTPYIITSQ